MARNNRTELRKTLAASFQKPGTPAASTTAGSTPAVKKTTQPKPRKSSGPKPREIAPDPASAAAAPESPAPSTVAEAPESEAHQAAPLNDETIATASTAEPAGGAIEAAPHLEPQPASDEPDVEEPQPETPHPVPAEAPAALPADHPASTLDALTTMRERARLAREAREAEALALAAGIDDPDERVVFAFYPPVGLRQRFTDTAKASQLTNAAMAKKMVLDHLAELEALMGPDTPYVAGYQPLTKAKREKQSVTLRFAKADHTLLSGLADDWPGCRGLNDLLSTALTLLFPDPGNTDN